MKNSNARRESVMEILQTQQRVEDFIRFSLCNKFKRQLNEAFQCVDGYPYLNRCPSGLFFDDISKFCTFKNEARCGPIASSKYKEL